MGFDPISIIYRSCDPDMPLPLNDPRYVSLAEARGETAVAGLGWREQLARDIRRLEKPTTFLVAGFAGDGKSTEFARLQHDLKTGDPKLAAIYIDTSAFLNPYEYSFTDVLLAIVTEAARQFDQDYGIKLRPSYWKQLMEEVRSTLLSDLELKQLEGKVEAGAFGISGTLALKARDNDVIRKKLWDALSTAKTTLVREFHDLLEQQARKKLDKLGCRDVVLIVDWLEKLQPARRATDPDPLEALFLLNAGLFQSIGVHLVLTLPLSMAYSAAQQRLMLAYNRPPIVINAVRVTKLFPPAQRSAGKQALLQLLEQRFVCAPEGKVPFDDVFPDRGLAEEIVEFSGGHPRTLLILLRECCSFRDTLPITREAFEGARRKMIEAASRQVREEWYEPLADVHLTHRIKNDLEHHRMLLNLCILSYSDGEPLYDVVPPITELKRFKEALQAKSGLRAPRRSTGARKKGTR